MKIFNLDQLDHSQPRYLQIAEAVRAAIRQSRLTPGEMLPSVRVLSDELNVNRHTVMKAMAELVAEGWLEAEERKGYQVVSELPIESSQSYSSNQPAHTSFEFRFVKQGSPIPEYPSSKYKFNFSGGQPDMSRFPYAELKSHMSDVLSRPDFAQLGYGDSAGHPGLIEQVATYLRRVRAITDREIVITNGSQEALFIVAQLLLKTGDKVAVEQLGYPPAWAAFRSAGAELIGINQDEQGLIPENLEQQLKQHKIRLLYLTPLHQYPTTVTLSIARRMKIYQLAQRYNIPIIEDDYDHEFHYRCQPLPPMASDDPSGLVIYLSTFSKIMFPGARIGMMAVTPALAQAIAEYRLLMNHKGNVLMQAAIARWMKDGGFERHLRKITRTYHQRRDHAVELINQSKTFEFHIPDGGMALWLKQLKCLNTLERNSHILAERCRQHDIYLQHEANFQLQAENNKNQFIRLGYSGLNEEMFEKGFNQILKLIKVNS